MALPTPWRTVQSLKVMGSQLDLLWPGRDRKSDGTVVGPKHAQSGDHYPHRVPELGPEYFVTARDITHDPRSGADCGRITEALRGSRDPRIKYVIFNRRVFSNPRYSHADKPWGWRDYDEEDPHTGHAHVSVLDARSADDTTPWVLTLAGQPTGGGRVSTLDKDDIVNVASAVVQWATMDGALRPDLAGAAHNLMAVETAILNAIQAIAVAPVEFTAADVANEILSSEQFPAVLTEAFEAALARVRVIVDPAISG